MASPIIKAKIEGLTDVQAAFKAKPALVRLGAIDGLKIVGLLLLNRAKQRLQSGSKTGRKYKRGSITHQASSPGESPATDTGKLVTSGVSEIDEASETSLWVAVSFTAFYARMLEFGTRLMKPRPFMLPTLDETRAQITAIISNAIRARLSGGDT